MHRRMCMGKFIRILKTNVSRYKKFRVGKIDKKSFGFGFLVAIGFGWLF